jgi:hypothetical protein
MKRVFATLHLHPHLPLFARVVSSIVPTLSCTAFYSRLFSLCVTLSLVNYYAGLRAILLMWSLRKSTGIQEKSCVQSRSLIKVRRLQRSR